MTQMDGATPAFLPRHFFLWLASGVALLTGLLEPPLLLLRRTIQQVPIEGDAQMLWMTPLANLLIFLPLGVLLHLSLRSTQKLWLARAGTATIFTLSLFALLAVFPRLHAIAWLILAAGLAAQLSLLALRKPERLLRWARRVTVVLAAVALLAGLVIAAAPDVREAWFRRTADNPHAQSLNVLLLVLDTVRWKSLSLSGYERPTSPDFDDWAREGIQFADATVTSPWTLPSHAGMFTGLYPHELEAGFKTPLESTPQTLAESLAELGYATAGFSANRRYGSEEFGLGRGFTRYVDYRISPAQILISSSIWRSILWRPRVQEALNYYDLYGRANAATINRELLDWIDETDRPFFAFVNYYDAHDPYLPPPPFDRRFTDDPRRGRPANVDGKPPAESLGPERDMYESMIAYLDSQLGALRDSLASRGLLDRTLLIITSDHGEQFGEHGMSGHGNSLYSPLLNVPLLLASPQKIPAGVRIEEPVTLRDLPVTIMYLATGSKNSGFPGSPLSRFWDGEVGHPPGSPILAALTWPNGQIAYAIRSGSHLYIDWFQEREELYDLAHDPEESVDLAKLPEGEDALRLHRALKDSLVGHVRRPPERGM